MISFFPRGSYRRLCAWTVRVAAVLAAGATAGAEEKPGPFVPAFREAVPFRATIDAARTAKLALTGIGLPQERAVLAPNDSVTALVSHLEGERSRQWLVHFVAKALNEKERAMRVPELVMHTSTGREIRFPGEIAAVAIRVLGPYENTAKGGKGAKDKWSGTLVNGPFLGLGLDRACRMELKLAAHANGEKAGGGFRFSARGIPFPAETIEASRKDAERVGMMEEEERAFAGVFPALMSFFEIISRTQGLDDILRSVVDVSWWGILKSGGNVSPNIAMLGPSEELPGADWGLPKEATCYAFKFRLDLNGRPALVCRMAVTSPRPPLLTSAGVVGLAAQRPDGKGPHLMIRLVDARVGVAAGGVRP